MVKEKDLPDIPSYCFCFTEFEAFTSQNAQSDILKRYALLLYYENNNVSFFNSCAYRNNMFLFVPDLIGEFVDAVQLQLNNKPKKMALMLRNER